ncbi:GNAT family N-acetyltransferase [Ilumatobacter sp.]|uniref:bifunctional acetate--CoA ligase family protein/GNAT family N-acetyltransferase n=1 Tax=Ilumatobacter sp. TaxID=1967498 RepID=UPI003B520435
MSSTAGAEGSGPEPSAEPEPEARSDAQRATGSEPGASATRTDPTPTKPRAVAGATPEPESRWSATVVLGDGESAHIRPLVPADADDLLAFHERQSGDSVYRRYFSPKPTLTRRELDHFTRVDMVDRVALAVEVHDEFVAWSSYERWPGRDEAEAAFMVDDEHHGRGIATLMLEHLAAIARTNGIERFTAEVLSDNRGMLSVFAKAGWPLQRRFESGVVDLDWELAPTSEFLDTVEGREHRADSRAVARILLPRSVAVVGASDRESSVGNIVWRNVRSSASVPVYPVNPRLEDLDGQRCYGSVGDLPDGVSLAVVAVPPGALEATIDACIAKRMRGAVIVTSVEANDDEGSPAIDVAALVSRARRNGLRLIGPSSMGFASLHADSAIQASLVEVDLPAGGVSISMQSGSIGASLLRRAHGLDLGLNWFVSLGDKSDVSANDLLQFWEDDQLTKVIGLYTETFGNPRKFARLARRVSRSRPIVAVRTGAAADAMGSALYQQAGVIEVPTVNAMLDACRVLVHQPVLRGRRVAVVSNSSSPRTLAQAALTTAGLEIAPVTERLDWSADSADYERAIASALADPDVDGVLVVFAPPVPTAHDAMGETIDRAASGADKPVVAVMIGSEDGPVSAGATVPSFTFPEQAAVTLARSHAYGRWLRTEADTAPVPTRPVDPVHAEELIAVALARRGEGPPAPDAAPDDGEATLGIEAAGHLLATYGIATAAAVTTTSQRAGEVADRIGYPVAVKAVHRRPGRSARAGVALDLAERSDVDEAVRTMVDSLGAGADRVVVQQMVDPGIDVRIHCERDPRLGVIVEVGYGGIDAEIIDDRSSRLAPVGPASATAMLTETKVGSALADAGWDPSPLVDAIVQAAQLCAEHGAIDQLDMNPVIVSDDGAIVTDVTVVLRDRPDVHAPLRRLE